MKIKKVLSDKQLTKMKYMCGVASVLSAYLIMDQYMVSADEQVYYEYNGDKTFKSQETVQHTKGKIHYFGYNSEVCRS